MGLGKKKKANDRQNPEHTKRIQTISQPKIWHTWPPVSRKIANATRYQPRPTAGWRRTVWRLGRREPREIDGCRCLFWNPLGKVRLGAQKLHIYHIMLIWKFIPLCLARVCLVEDSKAKRQAGGCCGLVAWKYTPGNGNHDLEVNKQWKSSIRCFQNYCCWSTRRVGKYRNVQTCCVNELPSNALCRKMIWPRKTPGSTSGLCIKQVFPQHLETPEAIWLPDPHRRGDVGEAT